MTLKNALYFTPDFKFASGAIYVQNGRFAGFSEDNEEIDLKGSYAVPGLIDIHIHGSAGYDLSDCNAEALDGMALYLIKEGVTSFLPTTYNAHETVIKNMCLTAASYSNRDNASEVIGIHVEGPFISMLKRGAQNPDFIKKPDPKFLNELQEISENKIKIITIAPEVEGAMDFISGHSKNIICSIAHSEADYQTALKAFSCGAAHVTHLFNGMPAFLHRSPGIVGAALDSDCMVELIPDGILVSPPVMRAVFKMFGDDRIILISDGSCATGGEKNVYKAGGQNIFVRDGVVQMENGTLVGPHISLRQCIQKMVKDFGIPLESAIKCATYNPAKQLNLLDRYGIIKEGNFADLLLFDEDLNVKMVFKKGKRVA